MNGTVCLETFLLSGVFLTERRHHSWERQPWIPDAVKTCGPRVSLAIYACHRGNYFSRIFAVRGESLISPSRWRCVPPISIPTTVLAVRPAKTTIQLPNSIFKRKHYTLSPTRCYYRPCFARNRLVSRSVGAGLQPGAVPLALAESGTCSRPSFRPRSLHVSFPNAKN